jgi:mannitol operon repressor
MTPKGKSQDSQEKDDEWNAILKELQTETPRGSAIVGMAFLDECLHRLLAALMVDKKSEVRKLLEDSGPLATFYGRILAAYCLGLINQEEFDDLNVIRQIRNEFAHNPRGLSFDNKRIINWCDKLQHPKDYPLVRGLSDAETARFKFTWAIVLISVQLESRARRVQGERRQVPKNVERQVVLVSNTSTLAD